MRYISTVSFDMTRRCNLKCDWCSRGESQNMDITPKIIDKALDELKDYYIFTFRITGGEPFLNPDMIEYLVDQIVEKEIKVGFLQIFHNGTIRNKKVKSSIKKFIEYGKSIWDEMQHIKKLQSEKYTFVYNKHEKQNMMAVMIISTFEHDNKSTFKEVYDFYNEIDSEHFVLINQDEYYKGTIAIEGLAEKNHRRFKKEEMKHVRMVLNKYCIIDDYGDKEIIDKTLSIAPNGNVYVGGTASYERADHDFMFNIMDCNGNLWNKVDTWCWENPISRTANKTLEKYKALQWQYDNGYEAVVPLKETIEAMDIVYEQIIMYEKALKNFHKQLPYLNHSELNLFVTAAVVIRAIEKGCEMWQIVPFIMDATGFSEEAAKNIDIEKWKNIYNNMIRQNNDRALQKAEAAAGTFIKFITTLKRLKN